MKRKCVQKYIDKEELPVDFIWNDGYWPEALDRVHSVRTIINELIDHPGIVITDNQKQLLVVDKILSQIYRDIAIHCP